MELTGHKRSSILEDDHDSNIDVSIDKNDLSAQHISPTLVIRMSYQGKNSLYLGRRWLLGIATTANRNECPGIGESSDIQPFSKVN